MTSFKVPLEIPPTHSDRRIAAFATKHTSPMMQRVARAATWAADEHVLIGFSTVLWFSTRTASRERKIAVDHLLATVVVSAALPHFFKKYINQTRPDRAVAGHNGIRKSGKPRDAFPSGHAVHLGAVASALSWQRPKQKKLIWGTALSIAATRVVVLAHWASDVGVGLIAGASLERLLRHVIGSRRRSQGTNDNRQGHL